MEFLEKNGRRVLPTVQYAGGVIRIIDQSLLPQQEVIISVEDVAEMAECIVNMKIRGAPAIGIAAAFGILLSVENCLRMEMGPPEGGFFDQNREMRPFPGGQADPDRMREEAMKASRILEKTRPTAVNLFWAIRRMRAVISDQSISDPLDLAGRLSGEAFNIYNRELEREFRIGDHGAPLIEDGMSVMTHCNAGGLATAGYGTALGVLNRAREKGRKFSVFAGETRPLLQGARLTAWELIGRDIEVTLLCDNAAPSLFRSGEVDAVIVGADRIAANGDVVNKVGTLGLAVLCHRYGKPFYVAAPRSTFDLSLDSGEVIPIEIRLGEEVTVYQGNRTAPRAVEVYNPAFDCTAAELVTAIITEEGVIRDPAGTDIKSFLGEED